jgi:hypothetical protein
MSGENERTRVLMQFCWLVSIDLEVTEEKLLVQRETQRPPPIASGDVRLA